MADAPVYDWGTVTGRAVELLKAPKIPAVPEEIVRQAQRSYDSVPLRDANGKEVKDEEGKVVMTHNLHHTFPSKEMAAAFAKHMKNAGNHTKPISSITVLIDPMDTKDDEGSRTVGWKAGGRRGRH